MGEELQKILQNSRNEEYTENKHSEESNVEMMILKKVHFRGKTMGEKTGSCHCFKYSQSEFFI
jgi:hypothetical protein